MDDFWLKIDEKQFEEISVEYARTNFPNWIWVGTNKRVMVEKMDMQKFLTNKQKLEL